ncbi:MAG TPA: hypothetical protein VKE94_05495 [Gemmataceae bacterium]|nr:hypothetical protein [Gemmataceae bacterium]
MRRLLLFVLAGLLAVLAQPAMANRMMVRGNVQHHHHVFFRHNHVFFHHHNRIFFASAPFVFTPTFTLASPFIAQPLPFFSTWPAGWGSGAFGGDFGVPVALGGVGGFPAASAQPTVIVLAMPAANAPPRRPEEVRPTVEQTASGVTIIRGPGSQHY